MGEVESPSLLYIVLEGFKLPTFFPAESIQSGLRYKARPHDVFVVTYPKCGTTWSDQMLTLIFRKGVPVKSATEVFARSPFLEGTGAAGAENMPRPGVIRTHFPYQLTPRCDEAKYIYVTRNPKDCCVSFYHHMKNMTYNEFEGSFDEFYELFLSGDIGYGDYFDHLLEWYKHKDDPNVLFTTYEEMKADPKAAALKFAAFLGKEYVDLLSNDPKVLEDVIQYSSFDYMKKNVNDNFARVSQMEEEEIQNDPHLPEGLKPWFLKIKAVGKCALESKLGVERKPGDNFVRKGIIGDWRNYFSQDQSRRMDEKIAQRLKGTEFLDLWRDYL